MLSIIYCWAMLSTLMCVICHGSGVIITGHKLRHMSPGHQPLARARPADSKTLVTFQSSGNNFYVLMNTNWSLEALILFYFATCWNFLLRAFWHRMNSTVIIYRFLFSSLISTVRPEHDVYDAWVMPGPYLVSLVRLGPGVFVKLS